MVNKKYTVCLLVIMVMCGYFVCGCVNTTQDTSNSNDYKTTTTPDDNNLESVEITVFAKDVGYGYGHEYIETDKGTFSMSNPASFKNIIVGKTYIVLVDNTKTYPAIWGFTSVVE